MSRPHLLLFGWQILSLYIDIQMNKNAYLSEGIEARCQAMRSTFWLLYQWPCGTGNLWTCSLFDRLSGTLHIFTTWQGNVIALVTSTTASTSHWLTEQPAHMYCIYECVYTDMLVDNQSSLRTHHQLHHVHRRFV